MVKKILSLLTVMAMLLSSVGITAMAEETVVYTLEELIAAFENGSETIVLGGDIDMSALTTQTKTGTITPAFTATGTSTPVWGEATANSKESFAVKLYEGEKVIAATMLNNNGGIIDGSLSVSWGFWYGSSDAYWTTAWEEGYPNATMAPDKVELYVDGTKVAENVVQLNSPDDLNKIYAAAEDKDGNFLGYFTTVADAAVAANEAGAKVVLKRETTETVEFVEGVVLEKNGFTAANVTVAAPAFVAKIGDVEYESLEEAFAAATEGQTITLLADATLAATATIPAGVTLNGNGKQINGEVWAGGDLTIVGHTKVTNFNAGYNCPTITIGEGACLELTGSGRMVIGHGATFNITGTIADAKTANTAEITPSLIMPGASFTGAGVNFNVKNAYIKATAYCSSKNSNANNTFNFNVVNSIWEQSGSLVFSEPTNGKDPTINFNLKDSVINSTSHLVFSVKKGEIVIDNSNVNSENNKQQLENRSTMTIKNGSVVYGSVATSSNAINPGTIIVDNASYVTTGEFTGASEGPGKLILKNGANATVGTIGNATAEIGAGCTLTTKTEEATKITAAPGCELKYENGVYTVAPAAVAEVGGVKYDKLEDALKALTSGATLVLLDDVTVDYAWDARYTGAKIFVPVTIDGNGHKITFTNTVFDGGNYLAAFRFEADATVKNLTIDMSQTVSSRFRAISAKQSLTVDKCKFIGNGSASNNRAIIFGEGGGTALATANIVITNSEFVGWRRGVSDNENGQDVDNVKLTGNKFNDASVYVSALRSVEFTNNTMTNGWVNIKSYAATPVLNVTATGNTLAENTTGTNINQINNFAKADAQEGFVLPVVAVAQAMDSEGNIVGTYADFESAVAAIAADASISRIEILSDITQTTVANTENYNDITRAVTIGAPEGEEYTVTINANGSSISLRVMNGGSLTVEENVTIVGLNVVANGFATSGENMIIDGTLKALSLKQWASNGAITVNETGSVWLGYGDGQFELAYGNGTVTVNGNGDKTVAQFTAGYSGTRGNGNTLNLKDTYFNAGAWFTVAGSNGTFNVNNSVLAVPGGDFAGAFTISSTGNVVNLTNGSELKVGPLTIGDNNTVKLDVNSSINASQIMGAGKISIDATNFDGNDVQVIAADMSGFTGTIEVINNASAEAKIENGKVYVVAKAAPAVAKIGDVEYASLADALAAAAAMTGDVTVEIYDKVTLNQSLAGNYTSIKFVGKEKDAEIYLDVRGYITASGKKVAFEDLTLSKSTGDFVYNAGFMDVAFGVYDVNEVTYTNCYFANGAYASSGKVTYTGCTFKRSHDKYGLWAYGDVDVVVDGCTFADYRGIKMYAEGGKKTVDLTVKNTNFSAVDSKPAIVLTYGESVTLENNTYSSTGVFELDLDGAPNGTPVTSDEPEKITCVNDNGACGVLVDGKIYTTAAQAKEVAVSGSKVTLLHDSAETVEFAEGVVLDKNGFAAANVTVAAPAFVAKIGETTYATLEEAFSAATEGQTITLLADATPALTSQRAITKAAVIDLNGKTLTLKEDDLYFGTTTFKNGNIVVDPSVKPSTAVFWMFANQTLTFDKVKITATGVKGTYLIGLDGNNSDLNLLNGSEIFVNNETALDLDIICVNASTGNDIVIEDSKVSVTNLDGRVFFRGNYTVSGTSDIDLSGITKAGFRIEAGQTLKIEDTATVDIAGEPRDGGIHITDPTAVYTVADTATVNATVNKPALPEAEVKNLGSITVGNKEGEYQFDGSYYVYDLLGNQSQKLTESTDPFDMNIAMQFISKDSAEEAAANAYAEYTTDFFIKIEGIKDGSFVGNGCYLAGYYPSFGAWVKIPLDGFTVENGKVYPVISSAGFDFSYVDICKSVENFICGIYLTPEIIEANPDIKVNLDLGLSETFEMAQNAEFKKVDGYTYDAEDFKTEEKIKFKNANMTLGNTLALNFYVLKKDLEGTDYRAVIKHNRATGVYETEVPFDQWLEDTTNKEQIYIPYSGIAAKEMTDDVTITLYKGETAVSDELTYSVQRYAEALLNAYKNYPQYSKWMTAIVDMLNYGAAAQNQFNYKTDSPANSILTDELKAYATKEVSVETDIAYEGNLYAASLILEDSIKYVPAFTGITDGMYAVYTFTDHYNETKWEVRVDEFVERDNGTYEVIVDHLVIADAKQPVTVTVYNADGTQYAKVTESVNGFLARAMAYDKANELYPALAKFAASSYTTLH